MSVSSTATLVWAAQRYFDHLSRGTIAEGARLHITLSQDIGDADAQLIRLESVEVDE